VGLSSAQVGAGLSLAGAAGLAGGVVLGDFADRRGTKRVLVATLLVEAGAMTAFAFARSFDVFVVAAVVGAAAESGGRSVRGAVVALIADDDKVALRAYLRVVTNVGASIGAGLAGVALGLGSSTALVVVLLVGTASLVGAALLGAPIEDGTGGASESIGGSTGHRRH